MKSLLFIILFTIGFVISCSAQPFSNYQISNVDSLGNVIPIAGAVKYHYFLEKKNSGDYYLFEGMDYIESNAIPLKIGEASNPFFLIRLKNDGEEYRAGMVAENVAGYYSGMGVSTDSVGVVPKTPGIRFTKVE